MPLDLYEWNQDAAAAGMVVVASVEVLVRNSIHRTLMRSAQARGRQHWFDEECLGAHENASLANARKRASQTLTPAPPSQVITELSLGFWRHLVSQRYYTSLWVPVLHNAFGYGPVSLRDRRREVEHRLRALLVLRNQIAHHKPIINRNLRDDCASAGILASFVHPTAAMWVQRRSAAAISLRPRPPFEAEGPV